MTLSNPQLDWHFITDEEADEDTSWAAAMNLEQIEKQSTAPSTSPQSARLFEFVLALAALYGIALFLVWQQAEERISELETELVEIRTLSTQAQNIVSNPSTESIPISLPLPKYFDTELLHVEISPRSAKLLQAAHSHFEGDDQTLPLMESVIMASDMKYRQLLQEYTLTRDLTTSKLQIIIDPASEIRNSVADDSALVVPFAAFAEKAQGPAQVDALRDELFAQLSKHVIESRKLIESAPPPPMP